MKQQRQIKVQIERFLNEKKEKINKLIRFFLPLNVDFLNFICSASITLSVKAEETVSITLKKLSSHLYTYIYAKQILYVPSPKLQHFNISKLKF